MKYWHELSDGEQVKIKSSFDNHNNDICDEYIQPDWCGFSRALQKFGGCWPLLHGNVRDSEAIACKRCDYRAEIKDDSSDKDKLKELRRTTMMPKNEDSSKPVNLGEIVVTVDDATVHLVGMIDELSAKTDERLELVMAKLHELENEISNLKGQTEHGQEK